MTGNSSLSRLAGASALVAALLLGAAPGAASPAPADVFAASAVADLRRGGRALDHVVQCFASTASHPSFAHLARYDAHAVYRLRIDGLMFETISFTATATGGTQAEVRMVQPTAADRARFQKLRGAALDACLGVQVAAL